METGSSSFPTKEVAGTLYQANQTQKLVNIHQASMNKFEDDPQEDPDTVVITADTKAQTQEEQLIIKKKVADAINDHLPNKPDFYSQSITPDPGTGSGNVLDTSV
ncbi:hypothetical protein C9J03_02965 [Photobacterium gaetbulicola]|uniref:Uncharacterized protein n=1 Tax=Photobacterium gaetbulicola Gung47 TaxID=658445 RepID=A0A0C5WR16_9GAMM|nr:hypothetical protein [Photobacterium gaetbulicola]AJR09608.1 hypothetical protein H744_2c2957 [Photobacterium gaetbulicola Gung47]PSU14402.1 hypothetical protein C9J03_02965 [Photobacterium gaetbulicola]